MNLQKLNNVLTTGMIGTFITIIPISILSIVFPIINYVLAALLILLMLLTALSTIAVTVWFIVDMNKMIDNFFKYYESTE